MQRRIDQLVSEFESTRGSATETAYILWDWHVFSYSDPRVNVGDGDEFWVDFVCAKSASGCALRKQTLERLAQIVPAEYVLAFPLRTGTGSSVRP